MSDCNHKKDVQIDTTDVMQVEPGVLLAGGRCNVCNTQVSVKLEANGVAEFADVMSEGYKKAFD